MGLVSTKFGAIGNLRAVVGLVGKPVGAGGESKPMNPSEKFLRFAAECELMAKFTRSPENKTVWTRMAERWLRCAQLYDQEASAARTTMSTKRHRAPTHSWAH
jgi:hypothetical protein